MSRKTFLNLNNHEKPAPREEQFSIGDLIGDKLNS